MPTLRQRKLAKNIIESFDSKEIPTVKALAVSSGYSLESAEAHPHELIRAKGVQDALAEYGFSEENAKKVVAEILLNPENSARDRLTAADMTMKVFGSYAPEKKETKNLNVSVSVDSDKAEQLRQEYEAKLRESLLEENNESE